MEPAKNTEGFRSLRYLCCESGARLFFFILFTVESGSYRSQRALIVKVIKIEGSLIIIMIIIIIIIIIIIKYTNKYIY